MPFVWDYLRTLIPMQFLGGFLGVQQDEDGTVAPQVGWAVVDLTEQPPEPRPPRLPPSCPLR